jgi:hypothetical protein
MKKVILLIVLLLNVYFQAHSQIYSYTGKAWGFSTSLQPFICLYQKNAKLQCDAFSGSLAFSKKIAKGIYPTIGYSFTKTTQEKNTNGERIDGNALGFNVGHSINSSILIQKHLLVTQSRRISSSCFVQSLSLILAPEYNYMFIDGNRTNVSKGEFALKAGICLFNSYSGTVSRNVLWDVYYRKGFTPIVAYNDQFGKQQFYKDEIGIQVRYIFRQRYDFSK